MDVLNFGKIVPSCETHVSSSFSPETNAARIKEVRNISASSPLIVFRKLLYVTLSRPVDVCDAVLSDEVESLRMFASFEAVVVVLSFGVLSSCH